MLKNPVSPIISLRAGRKEIKSYVYANINLPHLRFYYYHLHKGVRIIKTLTFSDKQMDSLKIICTSEVEYVILVPFYVHKFKIVLDGANRR